MAFGCVGIGGLYEPVEHDEAIAALQSAATAGVGYFDVAPVYGIGRAERRLGEFLKAYEETHPAVTVSTKVGRLLRPAATAGERDVAAPRFFAEPHPSSVLFDYTYDGTLRSISESLARLDRDHIEIVFIHDPDQHFETALSGAYRALENLRGQGVVQAIGVGMTQTELLCRFAREGNFDCFLLAGRYTLLDVSALTELLPLCVAKQIAVIVGGAFNSGILAKPWLPRRTFDYQPAAPLRIKHARSLAEITERHGVPLAAAALQFALGHPAVAAVLMGPRSVAETVEDIRLFELDIPAAVWIELQESRLLPDGVPVPSGAH